MEQRLKLFGMAAAAGAAVGFSIIDLLFKFLSGEYPLYQMVFLRSIVALSFVMLVLVPIDGGLRILRTQHLPLHLARIAAVLVANITYFTGLALMPLAEAVSITFVSPLVVTVLSAVFLREHVGPWRWSAVAIGFLGVLIILRPGPETFQAIALLPLIGASSYAVLHVLTRRIGGADKAATMAFFPAFGFLIFSALAGLVCGQGQWQTGIPLFDVVLRPWVWPAPFELFLMLLAGVAGSFSVYLISQSYRLCEAALVAPFEYIAMPMAVIWGVLIFGEWPGLSVWLGSGLIVAAGLLSLWRETRRPQPPTRPNPRNTG